MPRSNKKKTTEEFREECENLPNKYPKNKEFYKLYDYSKVVYIDAKTPVIIICKEHGEFTPRPYNYLGSKKKCGSKCPKCGKKSAAKKLIKTSFDDFVKDANKEHDNFFEYPRPDEWKGMYHHINIICPKHGIFSQKPYTHARKGYGCRECYLDSVGCRARNTKEFIEICKKVHNNHYKYDERTKYTTNKAPVDIICPVHGLITMSSAANHMNGHGCNQCSHDNLVILQKDTKEEFIEKMRKNPDHDNIILTGEYINSQTKTTFKCLIHDCSFEHKPNTIINGTGCKICGRKRGADKRRHAWENYLEEIKNIHISRNYKYREPENWTGVASTDIEIKCPDHGIFIQNAQSHKGGQGCPKCHRSILEENMSDILRKNEWEFTDEKKFPDLKDISYLRYDFFLPRYNLLIECDGRQHFYYMKGKTGWWGKGSLSKWKKSIRRDLIKNAYIKRNKELSLLRIDDECGIKKMETEVNYCIKKIKNGGTNFIHYSNRKKYNKISIGTGKRNL